MKSQTKPVKQRHWHFNGITSKSYLTTAEERIRAYKVNTEKTALFIWKLKVLMLSQHKVWGKRKWKCWIKFKLSFNLNNS